MINNFHELSMREARRCDLRNGINMKASAVSQKELETEWDVKKVHSNSGKQVIEESINPAELNPKFNNCNLRYHPSILSVLENVMYLPGGEDEKGNWGR